MTLLAKRARSNDKKEAARRTPTRISARVDGMRAIHISVQRLLRSRRLPSPSWESSAILSILIEINMCPIASEKSVLLVETRTCTKLLIRYLFSSPLKDWNRTQDYLPCLETKLPTLLKRNARVVNSLRRISYRFSNAIRYRHGHRGGPVDDENYRGLAMCLLEVADRHQEQRN